jgi:hypothetical protein
VSHFRVEPSLSAFTAAPLPSGALLDRKRVASRAPLDRYVSVQGVGDLQVGKGDEALDAQTQITFIRDAHRRPGEPTEIYRYFAPAEASLHRTRRVRLQGIFSSSLSLSDEYETGRPNFLAWARDIRHAGCAAADGVR